MNAGVGEDLARPVAPPAVPVPVDEWLDPVLLTGLRDSKNRQLLLKIESSVQSFLQSGRARLAFPPLGSYQRLVVHRVAEYYALAHTVMAPEGPDNGKRVVALGRIPDTRMPALQLKDIVLPEESSPKPPVQSEKVKIKAKSRPAASHGPAALRQVAAQPTMEQREEAYAAARARIMGEEEQAALQAEAPASSDPPPAALPLPAPKGGAELWEPRAAAGQGAAPVPEFDPDYCRNNFVPPGPVPGGMWNHGGMWNRNWPQPIAHGYGPQAGWEGWEPQPPNWQPQPASANTSHWAPPPRLEPGSWPNQPVQYQEAPPPPPPPPPPPVEEVLWQESAFPPLSSVGAEQSGPKQAQPGSKQAW